jgi:hypothetical protein
MVAYRASRDVSYSARYVMNNDATGAFWRQRNMGGIMTIGDAPQRGAIVLANRSDGGDRRRAWADVALVLRHGVVI